MQKKKASIQTSHTANQSMDAPCCPSQQKGLYHQRTDAYQRIDLEGLFFKADMPSFDLCWMRYCISPVSAVLSSLFSKIHMHACMHA
mmetsp:Transcript_28394/g.41845  ORF Transcript_28394/g.41845 Transcript_28394/m.41845 type:complete len:87 (-) Transcript_28394:103-363(-)